jgi:hypothetical protein
MASTGAAQAIFLWLLECSVRGPVTPGVGRLSFMKANQAAFDAGQLAERLAQGYYAHLAALSVAADPKAAQLAPQTLPGHIVPIGTVKRKDGTAHAFDFRLFLHRAGTDALITSELERVWLAGSLLKLGDVLPSTDISTARRSLNSCVTCGMA